MINQLTFASPEVMIDHEVTQGQIRPRGRRSPSTRPRGRPRDLPFDLVRAGGRRCMPRSCSVRVSREVSWLFTDEIFGQQESVEGNRHVVGRIAILGLANRIILKMKKKIYV